MARIGQAQSQVPRKGWEIHSSLKTCKLSLWRAEWCGRKDFLETSKSSEDSRGGSVGAGMGMCVSEARVRLCVEVEKQRAHSGRGKLKSSNGMKEMEAIFRVRKIVDQVGRQWVRLECGREKKIRLDTLYVGLRRTGRISLVLIKSSIYPLIHPCIHPPMHPFIHSSVHPPTHLSTCPPSTHPLNHLSTHTNIHVCMHLSFHLPIHPPPIYYPSPTHLLPILHPSTLSTSYPYKHPCLHLSNKYLATCSMPNPN